MKKSWLVILLGVSLALLLAGGVALAAGLYIEADKECFECWPGLEKPTDEQVLWLKIGDWDHAYDIGFEWWADDVLLGDYYGEGPPEDPLKFYVMVTCEGEIIWPDAASLGMEPEPASPFDGVEALYGEMTFWFGQAEPVLESDQVEVLFSDDCFAAMFVPEPGTIVLLGSGLAGLAGYASLRLRARRKRE